jgi:hypothetical protein
MKLLLLLLLMLPAQDGSAWFRVLRVDNKKVTLQPVIAPTFRFDFYGPTPTGLIRCEPHTDAVGDHTILRLDCEGVQLILNGVSFQ